MRVPVDQWLPIVEYRDFHDIPRWILAGDADAGYWLLGAGFDDDADEYPSRFAVDFIGNDLSAALDAFRRSGPSGARYSVAVSDIEFDASRRARLMFRTVGNESGAC
ncbi:MAG: hypothetical protein ACREP7_02110 [Lysobacter sp.]